MPGNVARVRGLALCCIPKNANTAMKGALLHSLGVAPREGDERLHRHPALRLAQPDEVDLAAFTAAFLRHPAARLVAAWANKIRQDAGAPTRAMEARGYEVGMSFAAFAGHTCADPELTALDVHVRPQARFLTPRLDFVGRIERLDQDWLKLQAHFSWLPPLERLNSWTVGEWRYLYDAALLARVEDRYREDLALWEAA